MTSKIIKISQVESVKTQKRRMQAPHANYVVAWISIWVTMSAVYADPKACSSPSNGTLVCEGSIPHSIPPDIISVKVDNLNNRTSDTTHISSNLFAGRNWDKVKHLAISMTETAMISPRAFDRVNKLVHLEIHGNDKHIYLDAGAFIGSDNTEILDLSDCLYLSLESVISALNGSNKMQRLQNITLANIDKLGAAGLDLNSRVFSVLGSKSTFVTSIDFSRNIIYNIDFKAVVETLCNRPFYFILSKCNILPSKPFWHGFCSTLHLLDFSYSNLNLGPVILQENKTVPIINNPSLNVLFHAKTLNLAGIYTQNVMNFRNLSIFLIGKDTFTLRNLILADNRIRYLDLKFLNFPNSIEHIDISKNSMVYVQPKLFFENNSLLSLDLSQNKLYEMAKIHSSTFSRILFVYKKLQHVDLSGNELTSIPIGMFANNLQIKVIDLSQNRLQQVEFSLRTNHYLSYLNLSTNDITRLSSKSLTPLEELLHESDGLKIDLRSNNIQCNACGCREFIAWILDAEDAVLTDGVCANDKGKQEFLDNQVLVDIVNMCQRLKRILIWTLTSIVSMIAIVTAVVVIRKRMRRNYRQRTRQKLIHDIHEKQHKFRFVAFLAFSGEDGHFVQEHVLKPLNDHLGEMTGAADDLICTGDRHFRLGCTVADQMDACSQNCGSVILVISPAFCKSPHCNNETHIAYVNRKPIILMFKERVEEEDMSPLLRVIFKQFTRVTWTQQEGQYRLSTSWENVCESLIDCMDTNRPGLLF